MIKVSHSIVFLMNACNKKKHYKKIKSIKNSLCRCLRLLIRLYSQPTNIYHKRESCASDITTTTLITTVNGRFANGSQMKSSYLHPPRPSYPGNV